MTLKKIKIHILWLRPRDRYITSPLNTTLIVLKYWGSLTRRHEVTSFPSQRSPITENPEFPPGLLDIKFQEWRSENPPRLGEFYVEGEILDRETCTENFELVPGDSFRLTQVLHWANSAQVREKGGRDKTPLEKVLTHRAP